MLRKLGAVVIVIAALAAIGAWVVSAPVRLDEAALASAPAGDAGAGKTIFWAGGCASCHASPGAKGDDLLKLGGGVELKTDFGTFVTPNISPNPDSGIGKWSFADFANAVQRGVGPHGRNLYPAFPYTSYARMKLSDVADLFAFIKTLPPVASSPPPDRVSFPFNIRRGIGLWKRAFTHDGPVVDFPDGTDAAVLRGRYLVEGPGHCGECHTPRNAAGGLEYGQWLAGAPNPDGEGIVPNITPGEYGIGGWSAKDIAYFLKSGFTPAFDSVGGSMVEVQENMAKLPDADLQAIAAYLKAVPTHPNGYPPKS